jgi:hypothetical protein
MEKNEYLQPSKAVGPPTYSCFMVWHLGDVDLVRVVSQSQPSKQRRLGDKKCCAQSIDDIFLVRLRAMPRVVEFKPFMLEF